MAVPHHLFAKIFKMLQICILSIRAFKSPEKNQFSGYKGRGVAIHGLWPKKAKIRIVVDFDNIVKMGPIGRGSKTT